MKPVEGAPSGSGRAGAREGGAARRWLARGAGPLSIAAAFVLLAGASWGKWTDVQIDFGFELYLPWQLSQGKLLYRDIAYRNGPLSPYVNALWFSLFGVSLKTLVYCNLAILAGLCALTYRVLRSSCDRLTATVGCLVLLGVFGFSQYVPIANYNYVTPYQHSQTHGLALSAISIAAMGAFLRTERSRWLALAGLALGLVFLTKLELFAAAAAACGLGWVWIAASGRLGARRLARLALLFGAAGLLPVAGFFAFLGAQMPVDVALRGVLGNLSYLGRELLSDPFYRVGLGLDDVRGNVASALGAFAGLLGFVALAAAVDRCLRAAPGPRALWGGVCGAAVLLALAFLGDAFPWMEVARALPLTSLAAVVVLAGLCLRHRERQEILSRWAPLALWALFALVLLGKMVLYARFFHYGFVLAMPATLLLVACLVHVGPAVLRARLRGGEVARAMAVAAVAAGTLYLVAWSQLLYAQKDYVVGRGRDAMIVEGPGHDRRGEAFSEASRRLASIMPPHATLAVIPEGAILNYWLRRESPSRHLLFIAPEVQAFGGEAVVLRDLRARPPDFIALVHRDHAEFGVGPFGRDPRNGRGIVDWIERSYRRVGRVGAEPFRNRGFGIVILERVARVDSHATPPVPRASRR